MVEGRGVRVHSLPDFHIQWRTVCVLGCLPVCINDRCLSALCLSCSSSLACVNVAVWHCKQQAFFFSQQPQWTLGFSLIGSRADPDRTSPQRHTAILTPHHPNPSHPDAHTQQKQAQQSVTNSLINALTKHLISMFCREGQWGKWAF